MYCGELARAKYKDELFLLHHTNRQQIDGNIQRMETVMKMDSALNAVKKNAEMDLTMHQHHQCPTICGTHWGSEANIVCPEA